MSDTILRSADLSRRDLMKVGLIGGAFLITAGVTANLTDYSAEKPTNDLEKVRESGLPLLRTLLPVMLLGAVSTEQIPRAMKGVIQSPDRDLARLFPEIFKLTQQLFDVLALPFTRGLLVGIWGSWENANSSGIRTFLSCWESSFIGLLRMDHSSLMQLAMMAWCTHPETWVHYGCPKPPRVV